MGSLSTSLLSKACDARIPCSVGASINECVSLTILAQMHYTAYIVCGSYCLLDTMVVLDPTRSPEFYLRRINYIAESVLGDKTSRKVFKFVEILASSLQYHLSREASS